MSRIPPSSGAPPIEPEVLLELLMEHVPAYLYVKDERFRIVAANRRCLEQYPEDQRDAVIGSSGIERYSPEQQELFRANDRAALAEGLVEDSQTIVTPEGERRTLLTRKVGCTNRTGKRYVLGISTDVTELRRKEREVEGLGRILDLSLNEIYIVDGQTLKFRYANRGALDALGYTVDELRSMTPLEIGAPESRRDLARAEAKLRSGEQTRTVLHVEHQRKDGTRYRVELHVHIVEFEQARVYVAIGHDISELDAQRRALMRRNAEISSFAYRTSHDLRAPVVSSAALLDLSEELMDAGRVDRARDAMRRARRALDQATERVDDIASLLALETVPESIVELSPEAVVDEVIEQLRDFRGFDAVEIQRSWGFEGSVWTDEDRLRTIARCLISNAVRYRDPEERPALVRLESRRESDRWILDCADNGLGVPEQYEKRLFRMFQRLHPRVDGGSGLGLCMARRAARNLGGDVQYLRLEKGSLFRVQLPAEKR